MGVLRTEAGEREREIERERERELRQVDINKRNKLSKSRNLHFPMTSANFTKFPQNSHEKSPYAYLMKQDVSSSLLAPELFFF